MAHQRQESTGVVIKGTNPGEADRLWVFGGFGHGEADHTSEFVFSNGTIIPGPYPFQHGERGFCMVQLDTGDVLTLGGYGKKRVSRYNPTTGTFTPQQDMDNDKKDPACAVFYSNKHGKSLFYLKVQALLLYINVMGPKKQGFWSKINCCQM